MIQYQPCCRILFIISCILIISYITSNEYHNLTHNYLLRQKIEAGKYKDFKCNYIKIYTKLEDKIEKKSNNIKGIHFIFYWETELLRAATFLLFVSWGKNWTFFLSNFKPCKANDLTIYWFLCENRLLVFTIYCYLWYDLFNIDISKVLNVLGFDILFAILTFYSSIYFCLIVLLLKLEHTDVSECVEEALTNLLLDLLLFNYRFYESLKIDNWLYRFFLS